MHRQLKGGVVKYDYNKIFGESFKKYVNILEINDSYTPFLVGTDKADSKKKATDIDTPFSEYLVSAEAALRALELPSKNDEFEKLADVYKKMIDQLSKNENLTAHHFPNSEFSFEQLPYKNNDPNIKHLFTGFHLLPYNKKVYESIKTKKLNAFQKIILYLYHYISLLDLDNLNTEKLINFLQYDKIYFDEFSNEIVNLLSDSKYYDIENINFPTGNDLNEFKKNLRNILINAMVVVSSQIVENVKKIRNTTRINIEYNVNADISNANNLKTYIKDTLKLSKDTEIATVLTALKDISVKGGNATTVAGVDANKLKEYNINGAFNPYYLLKSNIEKTVDKDYVEEAQLGGRNIVNQVGGKGLRITNIATATAGNVLSLPFLYGPAKTADNKCNLITQADQGDKANAEFIVENNVKIIEKIANNKVEVNLNSLIGLFLNREVDGNKENYNLDFMKKITVLLSIFEYIVTKKNDITTFDNSDKQKINEIITKNTKSLSIILDRLGKIEHNYNKFNDVFLAEIVTGLSKNYTIDSNNNIVLKNVSSLPNKNSLEDPQILDFYRKTVSKDPWYEKFFVLIGPGNKVVNLDSAKDITDMNELKKYRLNVKKNSSGYSRLTGGQYGGAGGHGRPGDNILTDLFPDIPTTPPLITGIWMPGGNYLPFNEDTNPSVIRELARDVYKSDPNLDTIIINIGGLGFNIPIKQVITSTIFSPAYWNTNFNLQLDNVMKNLLNSTPGSNITENWKKNEDLFSKYILSEKSKWERVVDEDTGNDVFVKFNKDGKPEEKSNPLDNCAFLNMNQAECLDFLTSCLPSKSNILDPACEEIIDRNFDIAPGMASLQEKILNINPAVAFKILDQFRFGSYLADEPRPPFRHFKRYKVQSVGSWLREMQTTDPRNCNSMAPVHSSCSSRPLCEQLGVPVCQKILDMARSGRSKFFEYLDILVNWVNANPQVLNVEETKNNNVRGRYPEINRSFITYNYRNPYKRTNVKLRDTCFGLERLKSSIMNNMTGINGQSFISNIVSVPIAYETPLNRSSWIYSFPFGDKSMMYGGRIEDVESSLRDLGAQYGYDMLSGIYEELVNTMSALSGRKTVKMTPYNATEPVPGFNIKLSENTQSKIKDLLEKFRQAEEQLREQMEKLVKANKLYRASHGYVDPFIYPDIDSEKLNSILKKHSNLLKTGQTYNRRAVNLIDVYQTIAKTILEKLEDLEKKQTVYERPMNPGYHLSGGMNDYDYTSEEFIE